MCRTSMTPMIPLESRRDDMFQADFAHTATNMPSLRDSRADLRGVLLCYTHPAPTELRSGISNIFQKVFDLLKLDNYKDFS